MWIVLVAKKIGEEKGGGDVMWQRGDGEVIVLHDSVILGVKREREVGLINFLVTA